MKYLSDEYRSRILRILRDRFFVSDELLLADYWELPLTGEPFFFSGITLVYVLFEIEKAFAIRIDAHQLGSYAFCTINGIIEIVKNSCVPQ